MRNIAMLCGVLAFLTMGQPAFAQSSYPKAEIFGGFSYLPADGNDFPRETSFGFQTSIAGNVNRWLGVAADFGGQYNKAHTGPNFGGITVNTSVYEYLAGPRFTARSERASLFVHALAGGAAGRSGLPSFSDSGFALAGGGGLDISLGERVAIRAFQLDFIGSFVDVLEDNVRVGAGIVIKFGS